MIEHIHLDSCDSTQEVLKEQLKRTQNQSSILVTCDFQKNGRGRGNHTWTNLPGSLCFSLSIDPHRILSFTALEISLLLIRFFEGSILSVKWPNDILNKQNKKCAGILIQSFQGTMIAGIGVNLYSDHDEWGGVYDSAFDFNRKSWGLEIAQFINNNRYQDTDLLIKHWEMKCGHLNKLVQLVEGNEVFEGSFIGIGEHGQAKIISAQGEKNFYNGSLKVIF
jgi:BirA family transcriptional regulator, biotin operon repressor / biotin---[acetyl-CoA-carboxylase] ligase